MAEHDLTVVSEWEAPDENDGEWPYPDRWIESEVTGELAARCRAALGVDDPQARVTITEHVESGGYSEYTQENFRDFTIACMGEQARFEESSGNTVSQLLRWLEGTGKR